MTVRALTLVLAACFSSSAARAQITSTIVFDPSDDFGAEMIDASGAAQSATPADASAKAGPTTPRLEKLKKLEFDRRPSTILKTWSTPPKPKEEKPAESKPAESKPEAAKPAPAPAAVPAPDADAAKKLDPEAAKKKADEEAAQKKAAEEAARKAAESKALDEEMAVFQRMVTLGDWPAVKKYLAGLAADEGKGGYEQMIQSLLKGPSQKPEVPQQGQPYLEKNRFALGDVLGLALAAPAELSKESLATLGKILRQALDAGEQLEGFLATMLPDLETERLALKRRQLALILASADELVALGDLLPTPEAAEKGNDREGLNLLARHFLARFDKDKKVAWLEKAWQTVQAALAAGEVREEDKKEALERAVDIAPKIRKELGAAWLDESFAKRPERGMEILAAIGSSASMGLQSEPMNADRRQKWLELQSTAAKALLAAAPERAAEWRAELGVLAGNWLREAIFTYRVDTSTSLGPELQRDVYGNFFYYNQFVQRENSAKPIKTGDILDLRPGDDWLALVEDPLRPKFHMVLAQLNLKVGEEAKAFPYIEQLAATHKKAAKDLVDEFLRVWAKNHDPNSERGRTNPYMFIYGFEERANGIPLTRSKQERNLRELGEWVARLKKLSLEMNVELVASAFTSAHSTAEVYRLETIEEIFGPVKDLDPGTLAALLQKMRANLAQVWRDAAVQKDKKTNRHPQDIQAEVRRGYELAHATIDKALADHPESWDLVLADASLRHDENDYIQETKKDPGFSTRREAAFTLFRKAAGLYAAKAADLEQEKETTRVYETWFYAALGACDLKAIDHEKQLAPAQIPLIKKALAELPGEKAERHLAMFTNALFTRMGSAAPAVKFRYVREGLAICGEHKLASEARKLHDYYKDLVTEIRLEAKVDGGDRVGHGAPFGLAVNIRHTREIERESGGFSKYLQNQNSMNFAWNYGRPTEDYREKFEEAARAALKEHFDVVSVTFNNPEARSRATEEYGWRVTPYAYFLLKPRGPQVDRVPPLRLDLDFLDTTGYAVIPVESPAVPIDAREDEGEARPCEKLRLTQTLDERQAKDGKLILEVKAGALGLVPPLETILDFAPEGFDVQKRDDNGPSVVKFDDEGEGGGVIGERVWTLTMRAREGLSKLPETFTFGKPKVETAADEHFRYVDADLASVGPTVPLERSYGRPSRAWLWWSAAALLALAGGAFALRKLRPERAVAEERFRLPEELTPFSVLGLLRNIEHENGLADGEHAELRSEIERIERHYFVEEEAEPPDLEGIARTWVGRAS